MYSGGTLSWEWSLGGYRRTLGWGLELSSDGHFSRSRMSPSLLFHELYSSQNGTICSGPLVQRFESL
eukprot:scaffold222198_cov34-Attheya_sp.AAC.1